ncbi:3079_t:CDS:2 [Acaulospora colombiana]|uniref:3079_t:CDS:1 n=1 Tax=Acaulospora colombiana TaxID=27376 RepID=A0ACA9JVI0_9GLOM|nr:3079_t:CDS:2 [Acaulospora colombiana]
MEKGPRLKSSKFFYYKCSGILGIHKVFIEKPASKWCLEAFINKFIDEKETELCFEQIHELFLSNLQQIMNQKNVDSPIRAFCADYTEWIQEYLYGKNANKEIAEDFVSENAKYIAFQNAIRQRHKRAQTPSHQSRAQTPPPKSSQSLTPTTPNKRKIEHEKVKQ